MSPRPEDMRHEPGEIASYDTLVFPNADAACPAVDDPAADAGVLTVTIRKFAKLLVDGWPGIWALGRQAAAPRLEDLDIGPFSAENRLLDVATLVERLELRA